jgi:hypothetical protein
LIKIQLKNNDITQLHHMFHMNHEPLKSKKTKFIVVTLIWGF